MTQRAWLAIGLLLLLIEDAGNTSHVFASYLGVVARQFGFEAPSTTIGRLVVFAALGALLVLVLVRYRGVLLASARVRRPLLVGYAMYAVAAGISVPFNLVGDGYGPVGDAMLDGAFSGRLARLPEPIWGAPVDNTGQVFVDLVVEESLELLAASFLATALVRAWMATQASEDSAGQVTSNEALRSDGP